VYVTICCACLLLTGGACRAGEIVLGMSAAFSGPSRALGIELYRGSMAWFEEVNRNGGVHGNRLVLEAYDDAYEPSRTIHNTIRLIEQDNVFLLLNYVGTPTVTRALPLIRHYSDENMFLFFPYTGAEPQRRPPYDVFVFNLRASYLAETHELVDRFMRIGRSGIAVFYQADAYGRGGWEGVRDALHQHGMDILVEATYRRGQTFDESLSEQVGILRAADPQAVIAVCSYAACAAFIRDAREAGWNVPIATLSFTGAEAMTDLLLGEGSKAGIDLTRNLINSHVVPSYEDVSFPGVVEYREMMDRLGPILPPGVSAADYKPKPYSFASLEGFFNARLLVEVLERLGPEPQRAQIPAAVESLGAVDLGIGEAVSFGHGDHQGLDRVYFTTLTPDGFEPLVSWQAWETPQP